mgnify:FL=1|tara:strand:- start:45 stop:428 length:384 start_codon:yes stop_codon:yes gene_type:complete
MEKYLYFRGTAGVAGDQDETSGSVMWPVSAIRGISAGDAQASGAITDDDDRFTIFFNTMVNDTDAVDHVVLDVTAGNFDFKTLFEEILMHINGGPHATGMITVYDGVTSTGLTGITGIHQVTKADVD